DNFEVLCNFLSSLAPGPVEDVSTLERLLEAAWASLGGETFERTYAEKLVGRIESPRWEPPALLFELERHGATSMGSSRAALHTWAVDIRSHDAVVVRESHRQVRQM